MDINNTYVIVMLDGEKGIVNATATIHPFIQ